MLVKLDRFPKDQGINKQIFGTTTKHHGVSFTLNPLAFALPPNAREARRLGNETLGKTWEQWKELTLQNPGVQPFGMRILRLISVPY